ncbi:MAG: 2-amino-4-hydroxy-6-hydroxymethyldihydropteridine diphosphokinase [Endomicrobia bacterium]|nr:2-amino-4-hydroxy-6-hydroxymethyldihydropteridine diphosphokinase [Endomicrobiia bacterium]
MKNKIYLGLGSNIGDRAENMLFALSLLQSSGFAEIKKISSFYKTSPVGPKQRDFYNMAAEAETSLSPYGLFSLIKHAEYLIGRKESKSAKRWGPRIIDIDILFFGKEIIKKDSFAARIAGNIVIPHKEIENRLFVLIPLNEIAPDFVHPILNRKINAILKKNRLTLGKQKVKIIKQQQM